MRRAILDRLNGDRAADRAVALVTALEGGGQALVYAGGDGEVAGDALPEAVTAAARDALRADASRQVEEGAETWFVHVHNPAARMVIVGAVHITQALAGMAEAAGYAVIVCDPRRAFADAARFPAIEVSTEWPDDALSRLVPDHRTAVVTLTHDPKIDDPGAGGRGAGAGLLHRRAGQPADPRQAAGAPAREGIFGRRARPHPRPHRPCHRRALAGGDRGLHHGRGDAGAPPAASAGRLVTGRP